MEKNQCFSALNYKKNFLFKKIFEILFWPSVLFVKVEVKCKLNKRMTEILKR